MKFGILTYCVLPILGFKGFQSRIGQPVTPEKLKYNQKEALKLTNSLRSKHLAPPLQYDRELLQKATYCVRYYMRLGTIDHSCPYTGNQGHGENLALHWHYPNVSDVIQDSVQAWYDEVNGYNFDDPEKSRGIVGHFTQLVWNTSHWVGMDAIETEDYKTYVVAVYDPPGNVQQWGALAPGGQFGLYKRNVLPRNGGPATYNRASTVYWLVSFFVAILRQLNPFSWDSKDKFLK